MGNTTNKLRVVFGDLNLGVYAGDVHANFSYNLGGLSSLTRGGREWIYRVPRPTFWRATTDNDRGSGFHLKSGMWLAADTFIKTVGIDVRRDGILLDNFLPPMNNVYTDEEYADEIAVTFRHETITVPAAAVDVTYTVTPDGSIRVTCQYHGQAGLPQLPVFGWRVVMPTLADGFTYEGLSGETYPDRKAGGVPGVYEVAGLPVTPYLVPQECGMHMDTRWVRITRSTVQSNVGRDLPPTSLTIAAADAPFAFSCLPYTAEELENATHHEELPLPRRTVLCVCGAVRGVGGIDSWGSDVEEAYHIDAGRDIAFSFVIRL